MIGIKVKTDDKYAYVTVNYRHIVENEWLDDLKYLCEPTIWHEKRYTFRMVTSIGVTRELNRHRVNSIAEQSTRYCNYSTDKFDNQVSFCKPSWINLNLGIYKVVTNKDNTKDISGDGYVKDVQNYDSDNLFLGNCIYCEDTYMNLLENGWQPQQAREVLPLCTATEIIHTAFEDDWKHFFDLRYFEKTGKVHPNMLELTTLMKEECEKVNIWNNIIKEKDEN